MILNRRNFLQLAVAAPILAPFVARAPIGGGLSWQPHPMQMKFIENEGVYLLSGIPYHLNDATVGTWQGFNRGLYGGAAGGGKTWTGFTHAR